MSLFRHEPQRIVRLFYEDRRAKDVGPVCAHLAQSRKPYRQMDGDELAKVAGTVLHGGVVAVAEPKPEHRFTTTTAKRLAEQGQHLFVVDGIGNPHNLGAIARSLAFFGFRHLILSDHPDQAGVSDAAYRIAEGGLDCLTLYRATSLPAILTSLRSDYRIIGTALCSRGISLQHLKPDPRPCLTILGNEEVGLSRATLDACEVILTLAGEGGVQSLNVAATAAILAHAFQPKNARRGEKVKKDPLRARVKHEGGARH